MKRLLIATLLLGTAFTGTTALALTAEQTVEREVLVRNADGSETYKREKADMVTPGERIVYSLNYYNDLDKPAENIVLVMPVPGEVKLMDGSAEQDGVGTTYSVDGGKTFAKRDELQVEAADKSMRLAQAEDITHIRWVVAAVNPGETGSLVYKGLLK
jgi:hypothetical protein